MGTPWASIIAGTTAVFSAVATGGAWLAARRANATADAVARIERDRWHAELTPQFRITLERTNNRTDRLSVHLAGPLSLGSLDEIRVVVMSSDDMDRAPRLAGPPTQDEVDAQVWGPYRFTHGADGADVDGRTIAPFALRVGAGRPFSIEKTSPPPWQEGSDRVERWRDQWLNKPMRLVLTCRRGGLDPWVVPYEVEVPQAPRVRTL
ncbi:hypothetical protein [Streptomyces olivochromogenes]|uniref:Uncharacterized protein n=1 Tax=Streptomyces olivochromogenes TaxID=1963 RepID=A0A250VFJ2_STROL|nr:hypothetical protein [Streptomyces olivochromogenes]KUN47428.1 hypothetical protein AQJ27_10860 [Streptomyces olivochromogenes]GAX52844.1 hypothetical protein SO3561_04363 [Streptomyces olivochromogenes]